eukprot:1177699-Prorocentrum_minimum.AAC.5
MAGRTQWLAATRHGGVFGKRRQCGRRRTWQRRWGSSMPLSPCRTTILPPSSARWGYVVERPQSDPTKARHGR